MTCRILIFSYSLLVLLGCSKKGEAQDGQHRFTNELAHESSPYLLQHAHNPVNWRPWGDKALQQAKAENKLLLISIGYAACHWCHVMEHESFEDTVVANIMNRYFVCIKVDREERPDVDDVYMTACQLSSQGGCGWPLNSFALPDGKPVWAGTYFPKKNWIEILQYFNSEWQKNAEKIKGFAGQLASQISLTDKVPGVDGEAEFTRPVLEEAAKKMLGRIDFEWGGRSGAPKFPMPGNYQFLLEYHHLSGSAKALEAVTVTLDRMANGGIYDHLGGGFARYSTDEHWLAPHFEKMLYDNAQLVGLYSQAYQVTQNPLYRQVVEEALAFVEREMTSPEGAFFSSFDADSEGEEGKFYVWTKTEIDGILADEKTAKVFCDYFEISSKGNWEDGQNILHRRKPLSEIAQKHQLGEKALSELVAGAKSKLFKARSARVPPGLDDKALTAWNALMLKAYVDAYRAFGNEAWLEAALKNARFITSKVMQKDHRLNRNFKDGKSVINAFLDDYALTMDAFIALYQVTFDEQWLHHAKGLADYAIQHFSDEESGLFFYTSDLDPPLIVRKMETSDNVIPGSNSVMAKCLYLLGEYFYQPAWIDKSKRMLHAVSTQLAQQPDYFSNWCQVYLDFVKPLYEVAIVGPDSDKIRNELMGHYLPDALLLGGKNEGGLALLKDKLQEGQTLIYVCQNKTCKFPVAEVNKALELMR